MRNYYMTCIDGCYEVIDLSIFNKFWFEEEEQVGLDTVYGIHAGDIGDNIDFLIETFTCASVQSNCMDSPFEQFKLWCMKNLDVSQ